MALRHGKCENSTSACSLQRLKTLLMSVTLKTRTEYKNWRTATISNWSLYGWQRPERPSTPVISHYCLDFLYSTPINAFSKPSPRGRIERAVHSFNTCPSIVHFAKFYEDHYDSRLRKKSRKAATVCLKSNIKDKVSTSTPLRCMGSADV